MCVPGVHSRQPSWRSWRAFLALYSLSWNARLFATRSCALYTLPLCRAPGGLLASLFQQKLERAQLATCVQCSWRRPCTAPSWKGRSTCSRPSRCGGFSDLFQSESNSITFFGARAGPAGVLVQGLPGRGPVRRRIAFNAIFFHFLVLLFCLALGLKHKFQVGGISGGSG